MGHKYSFQPKKKKRKQKEKKGKTEMKEIKGSYRSRKGKSGFCPMFSWGQNRDGKKVHGRRSPKPPNTAASVAELLAFPRLQ